MISNPSIEKNSTQVSLLWSPQFLWPGQRIDYYNISFMNKSNGNITTSYYRVNSTFSDQVFKLTKIHPNDIDLCTTAEIEFKISAVSVSGHLLPIINVTDWITPSCKLFNVYNAMVIHKCTHGKHCINNDRLCHGSHSISLSRLYDGFPIGLGLIV